MVQLARIQIVWSGQYSPVTYCNYSFECNICLDTAKQPVVTPCVHLFGWPCLHQWLHAPSPFSECPVCKGEVLEANVTPIYETGGEEVYSTGNPDLPPQAASKQKGQPEPIAANGRHKRNCNSGEGVDTKPGCSEMPPNPTLLTTYTTNHVLSKSLYILFMK